MHYANAYNRFATETRDFATWLLADPYEGDLLMRRALLAFCADKKQPTDEKEIREWLAVELVSLALEHNQCPIAADDDPEMRDDDEPEDTDDEDIDLASHDLDDDDAAA
jgi:hypothetical protein